MARDPQLSPAAYFGAAMSILRDQGFEALTIQAMCERLGVTKGSFYHHFGGMADFVDGLMDHWESRETTDPFDQAEASRSSLARSRAIVAATLGLDHPAERAIRIWSGANPRVAETQRRVDQARELRVRRIWEEDGLDPVTATTAARMGLALVIGYQNRSTGFNPSDLEAALDELTDHFRRRIRATRA